MPEIQKTEKIGVSVLARVSTKGGTGTYLYVPRLFTETYNITPGNVVEVYFRKVFKTVYVDDEEPSKKDAPIDLSKDRGSRTKKKKELKIQRPLQEQRTESRRET